MMTPDLRPISALTPAILATASHWALLYDGNASVIKSVELHIDAEGLYARVRANNDIWPVGSYIRIGFPSATCYPCTLQEDGRVVPECWPVLPGEEEIEEWRGGDDGYLADWYDTAGVKHWVLQIQDGYGCVSDVSSRICDRPNMRPSRRKGATGIVWVWKADK